MQNIFVYFHYSSHKAPVSATGIMQGLKRKKSFLPLQKQLSNQLSDVG